MHRVSCILLLACNYLCILFVQPSAEHILLFSRATFLGACSSLAAGIFRFLFLLSLICAAFTDDLLRAAAELSRVVARRRVEETSADDCFFFFSTLFAAAAAAASAFLS